MRLKLNNIAFILSFALLSTLSAFGQGSYGELKGTVTDTAGAAVAGATVEVRNQGTNETRTVTTDGDGHYSVTNLNVGQYTVTFSSTGFANNSVKDVKISVAFA